jgi:hypothetical protein
MRVSPRASVGELNSYDIEDDVVEFFREQGVNIKGARELGHRGKPDSFHAALAFREKRFECRRD